MRETIYSGVHYDDNIRIEKIISGETATILLRRMSSRPASVLSVFTYPAEAEQVKSDFLSWQNLFLCSGYYVLGPDNKYMIDSVLDDKKTASTIALDNYFRSLRRNGREIGFIKNDSATGFLFHKGTLSDFFDFDQIQSVYQRFFMRYLSWDTIKTMMNLPIETLVEGKLGGLELDFRSDDELVVEGLLLGYPVESTIAFRSGNYSTFNAPSPDYYEARKLLMQDSSIDEITVNDRGFVRIDGKVYFRESLDDYYQLNSL